MRLKGLLLEKYQSQVEHAYMRGASDAIVLEDVPCEMTFESAQGFIEHENEQHQFLPVFHLMGYITSIQGDFPFHISSLYFDDTDKMSLAKDCLYYPSPDELAHMIQTGKYFSEHFEIPDILDRNTYSFPARVSLTIIPPPNPDAYESAVLSGTLGSEEIDRLNLPIVYVGFLGSGVSRKTDKLLDYYGIDLDPDFHTFALTAESSGYTDPPLMNYIPAPEIPEEIVQEDLSDYYLTEEEERQMLDTGKEKESQAYMESMQDLGTQYPQVDMETVIIAKADRAIERRLESQKEEAQTEAPVPEPESKVDDEYLDTDEQESDVKESEPDVNPENQPDVEKQQSPDNPEEHKEVQVNFGQEDMKETEEKQDDKTTEILEDMDQEDLEDLNGADVADARAQRKIDEARSKARLESASVDKLEEAVENKSRREGLPEIVGQASSDDELEL